MREKSLWSYLRRHLKKFLQHKREHLLKRPLECSKEAQEQQVW